MVNKNQFYISYCKTIRNIFILILSSLITISCAPELKRFPKIGTTNTPLILDKYEQRIWDSSEEYEKIISEKYHLIQSEEIDNYLKSIGDSLFLNYSLPLTFRFHIIDVTNVNAFAFPNGDLYFTSTLIKIVDNEDQFASIFAHEIIHILNRHAYTEFKSKKSADNKRIILMCSSCLLCGLMGPIMYNAMTHDWDKIVNSGYSQELEFEADREGMMMIARAGYDQFEMINIFKKIFSQKENPIKGYSSHPSNEERLLKLENIIKQYYPKVIKSSQYSDAKFIDFKQKILKQALF